jgi:hypothetical protein
MSVPLARILACHPRSVVTTGRHAAQREALMTMSRPRHSRIPVKSAHRQQQMSLGVGTRLGPYEIVSAIGAGGMGEVYRARDTRLDRDVALKVVPDLFASDPERLARFEREAKTLRWSSRFSRQRTPPSSAIPRSHPMDEGWSSGREAVMVEHSCGCESSDPRSRGRCPGPKTHRPRRSGRPTAASSRRWPEERSAIRQATS